MGNEFIEKTLSKSQEFSKNLNGSDQVQPSDVKYILKHLYDIEVGRLSHEEVAKTGFQKVNNN